MREPPGGRVSAITSGRSAGTLRDGRVNWRLRLSFLMDVRHGLRVLRGRPVLTAVAAGSLALGVGVGTALFSVADALSLRPLDP